MAQEKCLVQVTCQNLFDPTLGNQMATVDIHGLIFPKHRREKWKAVDVIPMGVGQQNVDVFRSFAQAFGAQIGNPRATVEDQFVFVRKCHLDTIGIATVPKMLRGWAGNAATNPQKFNRRCHES